MSVSKFLTLLICAGAVCTPGARAGVVGPIVGCAGSADSPFSGMAGYELYTFENGGLPAGLTASAGSVTGPGSLVDSVEGVTLGHTFFTPDGAAGIRFTFDAAVRGALPTAAGLVWTDGDGGNRIFQAYDENDSLIGAINDPTGLFYSTGGNGTPSNYRFFGATNAGGISSIFISNTSGGLEADDLQFVISGAPEPGSASLLLFGAAVAVGGARFRTNRS